jgi:hypothetical protein
MGLNRLGSRRLRRLSALVGQPVIRAYARFFQNQNDLIAFTDPTTAFVVNLKSGTVEPYHGRVQLAESGITSFVRHPTGQ